VQANDDSKTIPKSIQLLAGRTGQEYTRRKNRTGIVSVDGDGNLLHPGDMEKQVNQIFDNMETLVTQANFKLSDMDRDSFYDPFIRY
jgi:hypothetical protein